VTPPPGCRFHPRCPHAMAICSERLPPAFEVADGHQSACWLHASDSGPASNHLPLGPASFPRPGQPDPASNSPAPDHGQEGDALTDR
jgi:hypothetical protein